MYEFLCGHQPCPAYLHGGLSRLLPLAKLLCSSLSALWILNNLSFAVYVHTKFSCELFPFHICYHAFSVDSSIQRRYLQQDRFLAGIYTFPLLIHAAIYSNNFLLLLTPVVYMVLSCSFAIFPAKEVTRHSEETLQYTYAPINCIPHSPCWRRVGIGWGFDQITNLMPHPEAMHIIIEIKSPIWKSPIWPHHAWIL